MRLSSRRSLIATVSLLVALWVTPALAAPVAWEKVDVRLHSEQSSGVLIVSGELPDSVKLPVEAELSAPEGSKIQWIGQILGGSPDADPTLEYTKTTIKGVDLYRFTMTKARTAQIEILSPGSQPVDGTTYAASLKWATARDIPVVDLSVRIPQGARIVQEASGAQVHEGQAGYSYYTKSLTGVKAGDDLSFEFTYAAPVAAGAGGGTPASKSTTTALAMMLIVVAIAVAILVMVMWRKMAPRPAAEIEEPAPAKRAKGSGSAGASKPASASKSVSASKSARAPQQAAAPQADEDAAFDGDEQVARPRRKRTSAAIARNAIVGAVLVGMVFAVMALAKETTKPKVVLGVVTRAFSSAAPCANVTIALNVPAGANVAETADKLFAALAPLDGMNTSVYDSGKGTIDVGYCESESSDQVVRDALAPTGLLKQGGATEVPAPEVDASPAKPAKVAKVTKAAAGAGSVQSLTVDTSRGTFEPTQLTAKAGAPLEITFGQGAGCLSEVVFADLGIRQSLEGGPVKVSVPALDPGTYAFACGHDMVRGTLVIQ